DQATGTWSKVFTLASSDLDLKDQFGWLVVGGTKAVAVGAVNHGGPRADNPGFLGAAYLFELPAAVASSLTYDQLSNALSPPTLISPSGEVSRQCPRFVWTQVDGATSY